MLAHAVVLYCSPPCPGRANPGQLYGSPHCPGWASAVQLSKCYLHAIGSRDSLVKQLTMPLMGQCKPIVQMLHSFNGLTRRLYLPLTGYYAGQRSSLIQQPGALEGPVRFNCPNVTYKQWAHAIVSYGSTLCP